MGPNASSFDEVVPITGPVSGRRRVRLVPGGRSSVLWYVGALFLGAGGLFTSWAGAVRWHGCWRAGGSCEEFESDFFGVWPHQGENLELVAGLPGMAEPLAYGALLTFVGVVLLAVAMGPWWMSVLTGLVALGLVADAAMYWQLAIDPVANVFPDEQWWHFGYLPYSLGALVVVGAVGVFVADSGSGVHRRRKLHVAGWIAVAVSGWAMSVWGEYFIPMLWSGSHDDPTWMWTFGGTVVLAAAGCLLWSLGRWGEAATPLRRDADDR